MLPSQRTKKKRVTVDSEKKDKLFKIFDKYQEESAILDPSLNDMVTPLMECVRKIIKSARSLFKIKIAMLGHPLERTQ